MIRSIIWLFLLFAVLGIASIGATAYFYTAPGPLKESTTVYIEKGSGFRSIIEQLERDKVVYHPVLLGLPALVKGQQAQLKPGEYAFPAGITPRAVLEMLSRGEVIIHKLTVPEGLTVKSIVAMMNAEPLLSGEITELPPEGSLLPETYHFTRGDSKAMLLSRMQRSMQEVREELWQQRQPGLPFNTAQEAVILASIVEKEARLAQERPHIASVYINRLRKNMKLQADPTTIYAIELQQNAPLGRLLVRSDLLRDLPHNTYMHTGLPPTAIANPGRASIAAVLNPLITEDLFFVARGDGGHYFAPTYKQHQENIVKYRAEQNSGPVPATAP